MDGNSPRVRDMRPEIVFEDGLGPRYRWSAASPEYAGVEMHLLRASLAGAPAFEFALRERVSRLSRFHHPAFPTVHGVERGQGKPPELLLFSDAAAGMRLSVLLEDAYTSGVPLDCDAALCILRQLVDAVAALHAFALDVSHGAISVERLHITSPDRLLVVDHALGSALQQLRYPSAQYWSELGVATPSQPQPPVFDQRLDVVQIGALGVALLRGYPLDIREWQGDLAEALSATRASTPDGATIPLPPGIRGWLARALQLNPLYAFSSAVDAKAGLDALLDDRGGAERAQLAAFLARCFGELEPFWTADQEYPRPFSQPEVAQQSEPQRWSDTLPDPADDVAAEATVTDISAPKVDASTVEANDAESPDERPRIEPPDVEPPHIEPPAIVPPEDEPDVDLPRVDPPAEEPPDANPPVEEPPALDSAVEPPSAAARADHSDAVTAVALRDAEPKGDGPAETEQVTSPHVVASLTETHDADAQHVEASHTEGLQVETAPLETSQLEAQQIEASEFEGAHVEAPEVEASELEASELGASLVKTSKADTSEVETAQAEVPRVEMPQVGTQETPSDSQRSDAPQQSTVASGTLDASGERAEAGSGDHLAGVSAAATGAVAADTVAAFEDARPSDEKVHQAVEGQRRSNDDIRLSPPDINVGEPVLSMVDVSLVDLDRVRPQATTGATSQDDQFDVTAVLDGEFRTRATRDERQQSQKKTESLPEPDLLGIDARLAGSPIEVTVRTKIEEPTPVRRRARWLGGFLGLFVVGATSGVVFAWNEPVKVSAPALGTLRLTSAPAGVDAYVNNAYRGLTPLDIVLPPGTHVIELRGETERRLQIVVSPGLTLAQFIDLPDSGRPVTIEHADNGTMNELVVPGAVLSGDGYIESEDAARSVDQSKSTN